MIKRRFAALPRYINYKCNVCHNVFATQDRNVLPEKCPVCNAVYYETGITWTQDEIR